jgi:hypothetical protein
VLDVEIVSADGRAVNCSNCSILTAVEKAANALRLKWNASSRESLRRVQCVSRQVCRSGLLVKASARELTVVVELLSDLPIPYETSRNSRRFRQHIH